MVTVTPWPIVDYMMRRAPSPRDPHGMGLPTQPNDPAFYVPVNALVRSIVSPTRLVLVVISYENFLVTADEFNPATPKWGTYKLIGPTLLTETFPLDPPPIAAGAQLVPAPFAVAGAQLGDTAAASFDSDLQGMTLSAAVSSPGNVRVVVANGTAAAVNLPPGTLRIDVWRRIG